MMNRTVSYFFYMLMLCIILLSQGCISPRAFLPSVEEEAQLIDDYLNQSSHIAVVTMATSTSDRLPLFGMGNAVTQSLARITEEELGVKATALDQSPNTSEWSSELNRLVAEGGFVRNSGHEEFLRERGFDAYLLVIFQQNTDPAGSSYVLGRSYQVAPVESIAYRPMFRIYTATNEPLMRTALTEPWGCDTVGLWNKDGSPGQRGRILDLESCANKFSTAYRGHLRARITKDTG